MYAPGTGSKWCLMHVLMYLWLAVLGLCVLLCGQGAADAMHLQSTPSTSAPPPPPPPLSPPTTRIEFHSSSSSSRRWRIDAAVPWALSATANAINSHSNGDGGGDADEDDRPTESRDSRLGVTDLFSRRSSRRSSSGSDSASSSSNISASDLDKHRNSQLDNVWYRIWRRRRQVEMLRWQRRRRVAPIEPILVPDTRPNVGDGGGAAASGRTKRDSRFNRFPTSMFQPSSSSSPPSLGPMHFPPKFYPNPPTVPSPSLTSMRKQFEFDKQQQQQQQQQTQLQHSNRHTATGTALHPPSINHSTMANKPKEQQHGLPGSSLAPIPYSKLGSSTSFSNSSSNGRAPYHHSSNVQHSGHNIHQQQHNVTHNHQHNHHGGGGNNGGGGGGGHKGLLQFRGRKYCSARDPANLAFEAGVVFEGRVRSMSTHNYSVTFQVIRVHKTQPGMGQVPSHIRVHFKQVKNLECDLHRDNFRNPAHIRGRLDQGKVYFIFGKFVELNNFTLIGQPMRSSEKHAREVRNGLSETYGQTASIEKLLVKGRPNRPVKLICKVNGRPPPAVSWYRGNQLITRNRIKYKLVHRKRQSQLIIKTYDSSDSGVYECQAKNRLTKQSANATIRVDFSHYIKPASPSASLPPRTSMSSSETKPSAVPDDDEPPIGAEECPPEQKERYCMNGGKCVYFSSVREFSCRCADGFGGERCDMKTPTTYNHSSTVSYGFQFHSTPTHFSLDDSREEEDYAI